VQAIEPVRLAATPTLRLSVSIDAAGRALRGLGLNARLQIRAEQRRYVGFEADRLRELFGAVAEWPRSLGPVPWARTAVNIGPFDAGTVVELDVPCTYDFDVAAAKYLAALEDGEVPLELLFSGTMFWDDANGHLQSAMIPWDREASIRMPISTWRSAMGSAFGDSAWLRVHRDVFARLQAFRSEAGLTTWEDTLEALLERRP
jgi:hypothetical protein